MSIVTSLVDPVRRLLLQTTGSLRAAVPPVAVEIGLDELVLARVKRGRRQATLEALETRRLAPASPVDDPDGAAPEASPDVPGLLKDLFAATRTRPGKLSLVLPDNLAKVTVLTLPERPTSTRQLLEMIRFKLRRTVPFRLDDALLAHQMLPDDGGEASVLVAVMQRSVLAPYEKMLTDLGARPGMVGLATVNLLNLLRESLEQASQASDAAVLNCTPAYFSLVLIRKGRLIFYRCKPYSSAEDLETTTEIMNRELATSLSYYQEKLEGKGIGKFFVRTVAQPLGEVEDMLTRLGIPAVEAVDLTRFVSAPEGRSLDLDLSQRAAPAVAAAVGG